MPQVIAPIADTSKLLERARTAARVLELAGLPFGRIDPCNVMAEFNELAGYCPRVTPRVT